MAGRKTVTYKDAGVDIEAGDAFVEEIKKVNRRIGGFGGVVAIPKGYDDPRLVMGTDGVGTKLLVADEAGDHSTIGIDLVAMVVNDLVVCGARPFAFLDYYAVERLTKKHSVQILHGIVEGCRQAGCELVGGETAELPGVYPKGGYDLAGFGVGVVERQRIIDGRKVRAGDAIIGLPSSGIHSNGYSLARRVLGDRSKTKGKERARVLAQMLTPTRIYVKPLLKLIDKVEVRALAHITGGGIAGNLVRSLPAKVRAVVEKSAWQRPEIFDWMQQHGPVDEEEMYRVFNMGLGMIAIVPADQASTALRTLKRQGIDAVQIGSMEKGEKSVAVV